MRTTWRRALVLVLAAGMLAGGGCKEDVGDLPGPPPVGLPFPNTPEQLMANFQAVYEDLDIDGFREVLDPEFLIYLSQSTIDEFSLPHESFTYDEEVLIAERQFSGDAFVRGDGAIVPGITRVVFYLLQPETAWEATGAEDRIPDALRAQYRVDLRVEQGNAGLMTIQGIIEFYLRAEQIEHQGRLQDRYRMVGQVDYTYGGWAKRPTEDTTWGEFKALFR